MPPIDIFLSYNSKDYSIVGPIDQSLRERGLKTFFDRSYLKPGFQWFPEMDAALTSAAVVAVFCGREGFGDWQQCEVGVAIDRAVNQHIVLIPVILPYGEIPSIFLRQYTWIHLGDEGFDRGVLKLVEAVQNGGILPKTTARLTPSGPSPYRGLRYFREEDAPAFCGREQRVQALKEMVEKHNFIAVVGASGSGKSSIVRAGLLPGLRKDPAWAIATMIPEEQPLRDFANALIPFLEPQLNTREQIKEASEYAGDFFSRKVPLADVVRKLLEKHPGTDRMLLVVDQWENLYTLTKNDEDRHRFIEELLDATEKGKGRLKVVFTLRGDFMGEVINYEPLARRLEGAQFLLSPMNQEDRGRAITEPIKELGLTAKFESGLVQRLLDDAGEEPGNLPLLEFALDQLWRRQSSDGVMTHAAYDDMGRLQSALATWADKFYGNLAEPKQTAMRRLFLRLVRIGPDGKYSRQPAFVRDILSDERELVKGLADERLLVTMRSEQSQAVPTEGGDAPAGGPASSILVKETVQIPHEALILNWPKLKGWVEEARRFLEWRTRLQSDIQRWESRTKAGGLPGAPPAQAAPRFLKWQSRLQSAIQRSEIRITGGDLLGAVTLQEAEFWQRKDPEQLTSGQISFVEKSRKHLDRSLRVALYAPAIAVAVAFGLAIVATNSWRQAENRREIAGNAERKATARQWAAEAEQERTKPKGNFQRAARLAMGSIHFMPNSLAAETLQECLKVLPALIDQFSLSPPTQVIGLAYGSNGLAVASPDLVQVFDLATGRLASNVVTNQEFFAFSPDARYAATCDRSNQLRIFKLESGALESLVSLPLDSRACAVDLSSNTRRLVAADANGSVIVLDANTVTGRNTYSNKVSSVKFSPDAQRVAIGGDDGIAWLWDIRTGQVSQIVHGETAICSLAFSLDGQYLATAGARSAKVWKIQHLEAANGLPLVVAVTNVEDRVKAVCFSPDGKYFATASEDKTARVWSLPNGNETARAIHEREVEAVAFSPDDRRLATASVDGKVCIWELTNNSRPLCAQERTNVVAIALSPDGKHFATAKDQDVGLFETVTGTLVTNFHHQATVNALAISPDGNYLATACTNNTATVWRMADCTPISSLPQKYQVKQLAFSSDSRLLGLGLGSQANVMPRVFSMVGVLAWSNAMDYGSVPGTNLWALAFSPDGTQLATAGSEKFVDLWDLKLKSPRFIRNLPHDKDVYGLSFARDGRYLATASSDGTTRVWQTSDWRLIKKLQQESPSSALSPALAVSWASSGEYLAVGYADYSAVIWAWRDDREILRLEHEIEVDSVAFGGDDTLLVTLARNSSSPDGTGRLWYCSQQRLRLESGKRIAPSQTKMQRE